MALTLAKGQNLSLDKADPGIRKALVGLGWDVNPYATGGDYDLDASAILLGSSGKVRSDADFVFYNQMGDVTDAGGKNADPTRASVTHLGDNRTGAGEGDDEQITVDLDRIPADVQEIAIVVSIHQDVAGVQKSFGQVNNSFIRIVNRETEKEVLKYDLREDFSTEDALEFGRLYRKDGGWNFRAIGQGWQGGLGAIARHYGIGV